ncbi:N-formylmaleamate deformylase (plasmid) [Pseudomonas sp. BYT-5]|uniref:N-formylmaleamate deformylase n=1 Tax=unclassified Pseudomonas TaxID=196821 RepID=UPI0020221F4E|nr:MULTISPECIES: N-formylmaleamate deformylase [unclassified Pseudomonas]URD45488.1 N-formylmaleamate deformylase [Pseudomonas sp. BYT-5]URL00685.1 N-formylmaleamate deformylase [Pseudomonas sp. BYT-1]
MSTFIEGGNVNANGIRQHYLRYGGKGQALILVPGITSPAITWGFVAERLGKYFDTYVLDVRGRGLSSSGPDLDYGTDTCAADIPAFAEALGLTSYHLVGHSMGARFAIRAAALGAPGLQRLVLVDPPVSGPGRREYPSKLPWYVDSIRQATVGMNADDMRAYCPTWTSEQLQLRAEWLHTCFEPAIVRAFEDFHQVDIHQYLPSVTQPVLLMVAGRGGVIQPVDEAEIRELKPGVQIARVESAGHMIPWDDLEGFFAAFGDFLGQPIV